MRLPLSRLSEADREWIAARAPAKPAPAKAAPAGLVKDHPVTVLYRKDPKDWADGRVARKCSKAKTPLGGRSRRRRPRSEGEAAGEDPAPRRKAPAPAASDRRAKKQIPWRI